MKATGAGEPKGHLGTCGVGVRLTELHNAGLRLDASAYALEARKAVAELSASRHVLKALTGPNGVCQHAHNGVRFPRVYVNEASGIPFLSSSDIIGLRPERGNYLSRKHTPHLDQLLIEPWTVLVSRSGTIGNVSLASPRIAGWALSEDAIRVTAPDRDIAGFVTAFLRSRWGRAQIRGMTYGSVVQHIEPRHLLQVLVPDLPAIRRIAIGRAFVEAALKRDEANANLDAADERLCSALKLRPIPPAAGGPITTTVRAAGWAGRLDATFHTPTVRWIEHQLHSAGLKTVPLREAGLTKSINAVTKFRKRVYVPVGGIPLLSSKQLFQIAPIEQKGLARGAHTDDLPEIALSPNMIAVTCSGTIGRVQIIPAYMKGWAANQHAIRVIAAGDEQAGFLFAWLASAYGQALIKRQSYGSVILELDRHMLGDIPVPVPKYAERNRIADLVLSANGLRDDAWALEQEALEVLRAEVERAARAAPSSLAILSGP